MLPVIPKYKFEEGLTWYPRGKKAGYQLRVKNRESESLGEIRALTAHTTGTRELSFLNRESGGITDRP